MSDDDLWVLVLTDIPSSKSYQQKSYFQNIMKKYLVKDTNKTTIAAVSKFVVLLYGNWYEAPEWMKFPTLTVKWPYFWVSVKNESNQSKYNLSIHTLSPFFTSFMKMNSTFPYQKLNEIKQKQHQKYVFIGNHLLQNIPKHHLCWRYLLAPFFWLVQPFPLSIPNSIVFCSDHKYSRFLGNLDNWCVSFAVSRAVVAPMAVSWNEKLN